MDLLMCAEKSANVEHSEMQRRDVAVYFVVHTLSKSKECLYRQ